MMRLRSWLIVLAAALGAGFVPGASAFAVAAAPAGSPTAHAAAVTNDKFPLNAVSADSSADAWAVGSGNTVLHWDGTSWTPVSLPGSNFIYGLNAVDALSASDVWAVGTQGSPTSKVIKTLIMHWDGTSWTRVPSPGPANSTLEPGLAHLSMDSATDGWATGSVFNPTTGASTPLVLHWDGTSWQRVRTGPKTFLDGVVSFSPTDATAVGVIQASQSTFTPTVFQWNGTSWARTATLHTPPGVSATAAGANELSADSATDIWAIGGYEYISGGAYNAKNLAWHWTGTRWAVMNVPSPGITSTGTSGLLGVAAISPANVWAVGVTQARKSQKAVAVHWDGTGWTQVPTPAPPDPGGIKQTVTLNGVAASGAGAIWAVGEYTTGPQQSGPHTLILHWTGSSWVRS